MKNPNQNYYKPHNRNCTLGIEPRISKRHKANTPTPNLFTTGLNSSQTCHPSILLSQSKPFSNGLLASPPGPNPSLNPKTNPIASALQLNPTI